MPWILHYVLAADHTLTFKSKEVTETHKFEWVQGNHMETQNTHKPKYLCPEYFNMF